MYTLFELEVNARTLEYEVFYCSICSVLCEIVVQLQQLSEQYKYLVKSTDVHGPVYGKVTIGLQPVKAYFYTLHVALI